MCLGRGRKVKREGSKPGQMESELTKYLQTRDKARVQTLVKPVKKKKKKVEHSCFPEFRVKMVQTLSILAFTSVRQIRTAVGSFVHTS